MTNFALAAVLHASILATASDDYDDARREADNGKPLVILVSTEWCAPCQTMKKRVIPQVRKRGLLEKVAFAVVNPDRQGKLARKLTGGDSSIPQLILFRKTQDGWRRRKLMGSQSVGRVEKFIKQGITPNAATEENQEE